MINRNDVLLNPYDEDQCRRIVEPFIPAIRNKFGSYSNMSFQKMISDLSYKTPREKFIIAEIPCVSFYYLNFVLDMNPSQIVDIGCGMNFFKGIVPGIYGIDPDSRYADQIDQFDSHFIRHNQESFESAIAINALHFCSIHDFSLMVTNFWETIKPGGRGYVTFNTIRIMECTSDSLKMSLFGTLQPSSIQLEEYFCNEIKKLAIDFLVIDMFITEIYDEYMDGNIRLVFKK